MKKGRFIIPGCTGFSSADRKPEPTIFLVVDFRHYKVVCKAPDDSIHYILMRDFVVLEWPKMKPPDERKNNPYLGVANPDSVD
jgi:hypothetical protein